MKKAAAFLAVLALCACGKKGELLPPLVRAPQKAEGPALAQRGDRILVEWKNPLRYIDGTDLVNGLTVEIWTLEQAGPPAAAPVAVPDAAAAAGTDPSGITAPQGAMPSGKSASRKKAAGGPPALSAAKTAIKDFVAKAKPAVTLGNDRLADYLKDKDDSSAGYSVPLPIAGKKPGGTALLVAVRVKDARGRVSEFTDPAVIELRLAPLPPDGFEARVVEGGVALSWKEPAANTDGSKAASIGGYNIYRAAGAGRPALVNDKPVEKTEYLDKDAAEGVPLRYTVRAAAAGGKTPCESEDSAAVEIVARDTFPPAAPQGIVPLTGRGFIALSWGANTDKDLAGYKVRRLEDGGTESVLLTPVPLIENAFQDTTVQPGRRYRYAVSAVDAAGNESSPAEIAVESLKEIRP